MENITSLKRKIILLMLLVIIPSTSFASGMDLNMMMGNDNITFGLADNNDDGESFGIKADLGIGNHTVNMSLSGVTVRGYRTELGDVKGRYDSFDLGYSYLFDWRLGPEQRSRLTLEPYGGFNLIGDMGMAWVQNTWHGLISKEPVDLPYDFPEIRFLPTIGLEAAWLYDITDNLTLGIGDTFSYRIHFGIRNDIFVTLRDRDLFRISLGWCLDENLSGENDTHEVQSLRNTGFILSSVIHAGIFSLEFRTNLSHSMSYGLIGFNPLAFMDMETFEDTGRSIKIGVEYGYPGYMHRMVLDWRNWQLRVKYVGGETIVGSEMRINDASFTAGYDFIWDYGHFSPFVSPWGGVAQYIYYKPNWETNEPDRMVQEYRPTLGVDGGCRFIKKGALKLGGASCAIDVGASLAWNMGASTISPDAYPEYTEKISPFEARAFIDLVFYL